MVIQTNPPDLNVNMVKKFFSCQICDIFSGNIHTQSKYSSGDIVNTLWNSTALKMYIETYVRNCNTIHRPSTDTRFKRLYEAAINNGISMLTMLIDNTVKMGIGLGAFNKPVNVAIDEHDEPYTGKDNPYLIDAPFHKFRGTDMAYRFATLDCVSSNRFTLAAMVKHQLDGIDNAREVRMLIEHALSLGIRINTVLMDRGYLDSDVMNAVDSMKLKYIIPAKDNEKVKKFKKMDLKYCKDKYGNEFSFIVIRDSIGSIKKANTNFVRIVYYSHKKHDFSFYTNIIVNENNVVELAELYRKRWGIENGYQERKIDIREKTHSSHMIIRQFLYFFSILVYNLWLLINLIRQIYGLSHIILMDFLIAMGNRKWRRIMNNNG
jgi:hypothetical protein